MELVGTYLYINEISLFQSTWSRRDTIFNFEGIPLDGHKFSEYSIHIAYLASRKYAINMINQVKLRDAEHPTSTLYSERVSGLSRSRLQITIAELSLPR